MIMCDDCFQDGGCGGTLPRHSKETGSRGELSTSTLNNEVFIKFNRHYRLFEVLFRLRDHQKRSSKCFLIPRTAKLHLYDSFLPLKLMNNSICFWMDIS